MRNFLPRDTAELVRWYERYISPLALISGFLIDNFILFRRVDTLTTNILLGSYLVLIALCFILLHALEGGRIRAVWIQRIAPFLPVVVQFSFGGLFSGFLILYSRSATLALSWIFIGIVAIVMLGNERFMRFYTRFSFQVAIYFTALFAFLIFFLPVVTLQLGPTMFLASASLSVLIIILLQLCFRAVAAPIPRAEWSRAVQSVTAITMIFSALYFTNAIPPLPLALKDTGIFHSIDRVGDGYEAEYEPSAWYAPYLGTQVFHHVDGTAVYVYGAIFAPTALTIDIIHEWQKYNEELETWDTATVVRFPIQGGRDGGYRGYSFKYDPTPGAWRVNIRTEFQQIIGRVKFTVEDVPETPALLVKTL